MQAVMEKMASGKIVLSNENKNIYVYNNNYLYILSAAEDFVEEMGDYFFLKNDCDSVEKIQQLKNGKADILKKALAQIKRIRAHVAQTQAKQEIVEIRVYESLYERMRKEFASKITADIEKLEVMLDGVFQGYELYEEVSMFATMYNNQGNGVINSMLITFYKYEEPIRLLHIELQKIKEYRNRLAAKTKIPDDYRGDIKDLLDRYEKIVNKRLNSLTNKGWKYNLGAYIYFSNLRASNTEKYGLECQELVEKTIICSEKATSLPQYRYCEELYEKQVNVCEAKGRQ